MACDGFRWLNSEQFRVCLFIGLTDSRGAPTNFANARHILGVRSTLSHYVTVSLPNLQLLPLVSPIFKSTAFPLVNLIFTLRRQQLSTSGPHPCHSIHVALLRIAISSLLPLDYPVRCKSNSGQHLSSSDALSQPLSYITRNIPRLIFPCDFLL